MGSMLTVTSCKIIGQEHLVLGAQLDPTLKVCPGVCLCENGFLHVAFSSLEDLHNDFHCFFFCFPIGPKCVS